MCPRRSASTCSAIAAGVWFGCRSGSRAPSKQNRNPNFSAACSRLVRGLTACGCGVLGKFLLGGLRALDLELVEQKRGAGDAEPDGLSAVLDRGRGSGGDEIAAQGADVEISEDSAANQFLMRVFGPDAIEEPGLERRPHGFHVESVGQFAL